MPELIRSKDIFSEAKKLLSGQDENGNPVEKDLDKSEALLNEILSNNVGNIDIIYVLGSLHLERGNAGLAVQLLSQVTLAVPQFGEAWNNLGLAFRGCNDFERAETACKKAVDLIPHPDLPCNLAGLFINRNRSEEVIKYADRALALRPDHIKAKWHKCMGLLEMGRYQEAWPLHETRLEGGANENIVKRNYHGDEETPMWDGFKDAKVAIHGEQGMGDEIAFASCVPDAIENAEQVILEPSPRLEGLFKRSFPQASVYGTDQVNGERWIDDLGPPDFKAPLGTLPMFYRNKKQDFPGKPFLVACDEKRDFWQRKLGALGQRPNVGLAWQGGVQSTRVEVRSFHPRTLHPLFHHDVNWVSLQYDSTAPENVQEVRNELGVDIHHWPKAVSAMDPETGKLSDLDELAALVSCLDLVISVPQTAYHIAGGLGVACWVMCPSEPDWRLGNEGEDNPWYESVKVIRQPKGTRDWVPVISEVDQRLGAWLKGEKDADFG